MANFYKGSFVNTQVDYSDNSPNEQTIYVKITNTAENDLTEVELETADAPVVFQTVDNSEDKFTVIKSKSCRLRVFTNNDVNAMTFAGGGDNQYKVEIAVGTDTEIVFTGWLSISDLGQTFQPDPNVLELIATDGIAFLRDLPLTDDEGRNLTGPHPLIKYISWCLEKTGLELPIWVEMNLLEVSATYDVPADHFYNMLYLNAQTFETSIGELENCYSVLEKLLKEFCDISQQKNVWFIRSTDEAGYAIKRVCKFDYTGEPIAFDAPFLVKDIGAEYDMAFMNDDARLSLQRPYKAVKHTFDYEYPLETPINNDFERGEFMMNLPDETIDGITYTVKAYYVDDWTAYGNYPNSPSVPAFIPYIKKYFNDLDYESFRYFVIPYYNTLNVNDNVQSSAIYVQKGDKIDFTIDWKTTAPLPSGPAVPIKLAILTLKGDDGNWYQLGGDLIQGAVVYNDTANYQWLDTANFTAFPAAGTVRINTDLYDEMEWQTQSWDGTRIPVSGKLYIRLFPISNSNQAHYQNIQLTIYPLINGSYVRYTGQQHISEQQVDNMAVRDETVYMSDAPRIEMKGALLLTELGDTVFSGNAIFAAGNGVNLDGFYTPFFNINDYIEISNTSLNNGKYRIVAVEYSLIPNKTILTFAEPTVSETDASTTIKGFNYLLSGNFYDSIEFQGSPPQEDQLPYGQHQNQAVWNQYNRVFTAFEATCDGLDTEKTYDGEPDLPDLLHLYRQKDAHPATTNKGFKLLHYEQDTDNCEWGLYMIEVVDSTIPKTYEGHSFKYIQE
jgi:hypothetical protein